MFTGIIEQVGRVVDVERHDFGATISIDRGDWTHLPQPGASIAVNGCCLTVAGLDEARGEPAPAPTRLRFDVIRQTLDVTTLGALEPGDIVNLEHAVTPETMLGGHIVQGHVDGVGLVREVVRSAEEWRIRIQPPPVLADVIVDKGSIAVDGVSLTVAALASAERDAPWFEVALIPTTLRETNLDRLEVDGRVNLEGDYVAKIVVQWLERSGGAAATRSP
jgi:riboflavin synthase